MKKTRLASKDDEDERKNFQETSQQETSAGKSKKRVKIFKNVFIYPR
jgi:hypothetical protein